MRVFNKILVPTDFSPCADTALSQAVWLARLVGAEVTASHVIPLTQDAMASLATNPWYLAAGSEDVEERIRHGIDKRLEEAISSHRSKGVTLEHKTLLGPPFVEIIQAVQDEEFDLVVVGTRGHSAVSRFLVGSVTSKLARKCPCPVWVAKPAATNQLATILAPVDFSELSRKSLKLAAQLSARADCSLHVLHVCAAQDAFPWGLLPEDGDTSVAQRRRLQYRQAIEHLRSFVKEAGLPVEPTLHVERGEPWKRILTTAKQIDAGLTVLGTVGRGGVAGLLIGNTAENVLHSSRSSVLAVKPDGFVSPIQLRQAAAHV